MKNIFKRNHKTEADIIDLILDDHEELKKHLEILKDTDLSFNERKNSFEIFAPLLFTHSKSEEQTLYLEMERDDELRVEGFEGEVEHKLADQLISELKMTKDRDLWCAKAKVLAELVEHHIEIEEEEHLPDFKHVSDKQRRIELGQKFLRLKMDLKDFNMQYIPNRSTYQPSIH